MVTLELAVLAFIFGAVLLLMYVMMNGDSEMHERDCIGFLFRRMVDAMDFFGGERFTSQVERIVGKACCARMYAWQDYVFYQKNPIMPGIYVSFVAAGFTVFAVFAFPYIPFGVEHEWGISFYHKINAFWIVALCAAVFWGNIVSDPGVITASNVHEEMQRYPVDGIIYKTKNCHTCKQPRPARSKHCSTCNHCCARFDHHCPWINNCGAHA
jgi:hypothetical protein